MMAVNVAQERNRTIRVTTEGEGERRVVSTIQGHYAVHPQLIPGAVAPQGWAVTHLSSGICVWPVLTREEAVSVAAWLNAHAPFPADADFTALMAWPVENPAAVNALKESLTAIAPKYSAPERNPS